MLEQVLWDSAGNRAVREHTQIKQKNIWKPRSTIELGFLVAFPGPGRGCPAQYLYKKKKKSGGVTLVALCHPRNL